MHRPSPVSRRTLLATTLLCSLFAPGVYAFNPHEDVAPASSAVKPLTGTLVAQSSSTPLYTPGMVTPTVAPSYISPLAPIQMPQKPLYPERSASTVAPVVPAATPQVAPAMIAPAPVMAAPVSAPMAAPSVAPALPPVDPAVVARAQAIMAAEQQAAQPMSVAQPLAAPASGFVAPAPVFAVPASAVAAAPEPIAPPIRSMPTPMAAPVIASPAPTVPAAAPLAPPLPVMTAAPGMPAPVIATGPELSDETRTILSHVPAAIDTPKMVAGKIALQRVDPEIKEVLGHAAQEESYESVGLSIKVRRPGLDTNYELNRAYTALMGGDTQTAIETYKNILSVEPRNEDALFGLAATYHRLGMTDQARPFYGMLMKVNPNHREGLNNFLVLVSDESPQDALPELERLEARNPEFSPIPAQIAIVLDKLGYADASKEKMLRAIELAPDNMSYKYNLAVMLDRRGEYANAASLYRMLIEASLRGAAVPASTEAMQKRLTYLVTAMTTARTAMSQ